MQRRVAALDDPKLYDKLYREETALKQRTMQKLSEMIISATDSTAKNFELSQAAAAKDPQLRL
jgi:hypothetical protein